MSSLCERCRGACCEEVEVPVPLGFARDFFTQEWVAARGGEVILAPGAGTVRVESWCSLLTPHGQCSVHDTSDQPTVCRLAAPGEDWCLDVIRRRRPALWNELEQEER